MTQEKIVGEVLGERTFQDEKWGEQNHSPADWLAILGEEVGEANTGYLEYKFEGKPLRQYRDELIQVAAVAIAAVECFDRMEMDQRIADLECDECRRIHEAAQEIPECNRCENR